MPSVGTLGNTLPSGPKNLKVKCQVFPHDGSTELKRPAPASPPVTDNHHGAGAEVHLDVAGRSENLLVDTGATYSVLTCYSGAFSSQTSTILGAIVKTLQKDAPEHFVAWMDRYFPTSFWWSLSILLPYWEEVFPCLQNLVAIAVLIEDALKLSTGGKLAIFTTHHVEQLLNGRGHLWMSDQRILRYQVVLVENSGLTMFPCEVPNPATILPTHEGSLPFHSCLETISERDCRKSL